MLLSFKYQGIWEIIDKNFVSTYWEIKENWLILKGYHAPKLSPDQICLSL